MKTDFAASTNLAKFRPLSAEMQKRVRDGIEETKRLLAKEEAYLPENQNTSYMLYLRNHLRMLENELALAAQ